MIQSDKSLRGILNTCFFALYLLFVLVIFSKYLNNILKKYLLDNGMHTNRKKKTIKFVILCHYISTLTALRNTYNSSIFYNTNA